MAGSIELLGSQAVADASFVLAFLLPDEKNDLSDLVLKLHVEGKITLISPSILYFEVINSLRSCILRKRITKAKGRRLTKDFIGLRIKTHDVDFEDVFSIALKRDISIYDASYLHLANSNKLPLLSLDETLAELARFRYNIA